MQLKSFGAALVLLTGSSVAMASNYQFDVGGGVQRLDFDTGGDIDTLFLDGEFHFMGAVNTSNRPLAEAAFLDRSSNVFVRAARSDFGPADIDMVGAGIEFYIPGDFFYARAEVSRASNGATETGFMVMGGLTPIDGLRVSLGYADEFVPESAGPFFVPFGLDEAFILDAKYVLGLGGTSALNLEATITLEDNADAFQLGADFYINRAISIGGAYTYVDIDNVGDTHAFTLRGRFFITDSISASAQVGINDDDDLGFGVRGNFRF